MESESAGAPFQTIIATTRTKLPITIAMDVSIKNMKIFSSRSLSMCHPPLYIYQNQPSCQCEEQNDNHEDKRSQQKRRIIQRYGHHLTIVICNERSQWISRVKY